MARRARSLNELPGHLRVPILRRKDTQRTKERLAAGLAGMEELRCLREQQQQLVGETVAKAEEQRHERQVGERSLNDDCVSRHNNPSLTSMQTSPSPRYQARSFFRGYSMDSISEEVDVVSNNNHHLAKTINNNNYYQPDLNNNNSDHNDITGVLKGPEYGQSSQNDQLSPFDFSNFASFRSFDNLNDTHPAVICQNQNHERYENETKPQGHPTQQENMTDSNPLRCRNGNEVLIPHKQRRNLVEDKMSFDPMIPRRGRYVSGTPGKPQPSVSSRQRSLSVDMGHGDIRGSQPSQHIPFSKIGNRHKFSSLSSININANERIDTVSRNDETPLCVEDRSRLSQSMSHINDVGRSQSASTLKRRGSLTWDSLLKSRGIQNTSTAISENVHNDMEDDLNTDKQENGDELNASSFCNEESKNILNNRKKGRSMSFTCRSSVGMNSTFPCMNSSSLLPGKDGKSDSTVENVPSSPSDLHSQKNIHPMLRRASIQCEAVLTHCNKVVNPIEDVDLASFNSPGPLHAVMLQYRNYTSHSESADKHHAINNTNNTIAGSPSTPAVSSRCPPTRSNATVKHLLSQSRDSSSNLHSHLHDSGSENLCKSPSLATTDQKCANVTHEINENESTIRSEGDKIPESRKNTTSKDYKLENNYLECTQVDKDSNKNEEDKNDIHTLEECVSSTVSDWSEQKVTECNKIMNTNQCNYEAFSQCHQGQLYKNNIKLTKNNISKLAKCTNSRETDIDNDFQEGKPKMNLEHCEGRMDPFSDQRDAEDIDCFRNKRSSIFSDVSLISYSSSKTPSSSASVFSDVSMVSDEGYNTCESLSPESRSIFSKRFGNSVSIGNRNTRLFSGTMTEPSYTIEEKANYEEYHDKSDQNTRKADKICKNSSKQCYDPKTQNILPTTDKEQKTNNNHIVYKKPLKQTTV